MGAQALGVLHHAGAEVDHPGDGTAVKRQQLVLAGEGGHHARIQHVRVGVALDAVFEIGRHLEQLAKVRVVLLQQVVKQPVAKQDDLDVQRDGFGLQRDGADQAVHLRQRLQPDLA